MPLPRAPAAATAVAVYGVWRCGAGASAAVCGGGGGAVCGGAGGGHSTHVMSSGTPARPSYAKPQGATLTSLKASAAEPAAGSRCS